MTPERIYTIAELSELVGKPAHFIRDAIRRGFLACHQHCERGRIHITLSQWQDYLDGTLTVSTVTKAGGQRRRSRGRTVRRGDSAKTHQDRRSPSSYLDISF
jgi:hypothetical protein